MALVALTLSLGVALSGNAQPNFVVILCDDLGYGDLACYGNETIQTPNLDRLASEGVRLTDCYSAAPVCSPSRVGLLTGRVPTRAGVYDWIPGTHPMHLRRGETTVAGLLRDAGYATGHFGKWHCSDVRPGSEQPNPGDHGFEHWFSTKNNAQPSHRDPQNFVRNGELVGPLQGFSCHLVADEAITWITDQAQGTRPFFAFVCFHEPHEPIDSPDALVEQYPEATERGEALYYANVTNMDAAVGRLVACVDELGLGERTLILFTSDNGPETLNRYGGAWRSHGTPGPLRGMKLHLYEGGIRVPGIVRFPPLVEAGSVSSEPMSGVDVLPTLCGLAGVEVPADRHLDGADATPILRGERVERVTPLFWHYYNAFPLPKAALRDGDWMLLAITDDDRERPGGSVRDGDMERLRGARIVGFELYHLGDDLAETTDLADERPDVLDRLAPCLRSLYREIIDEGPDWQLND